MIRGTAWAGLAVLGAALLAAASPSPAIEARSPAVAAVKPATQADLSVTAIHASRCKSDLSDVDAFYMGDINVNVAKRDISTPASARTEPSVVVGTLKVTYHDLLAGRVVTQNLMIANSNIGSVAVVRTPVLVKKSVGIKAEFLLNPLYATTDPNTANNVLIKNECQVLIH